MNSLSQSPKHSKGVSDFDQLSWIKKGVYVEALPSRLISLLNYNSSSEINEITGLRTINSIKYFIKIGRFSANKTEITNIVESKKDILNKISELRNIRPFRKPTESDLKKFQEFDNLNLESKVEIDPYENFHFGGLSGEEAHTAYWNCD